MIAEELILRNYRNIREADILFSPGTNLIFGENAQGKTNLIEALYYFSRGRSFRGSKDKAIPLFGESFATMCLAYHKRNRKETLFYGLEDGKKQKKINGRPVEKAAEMLGRFQAVLFTPSHLSVIKGSPDERREFLNVAIATRDPSYIPMYAEYLKVLSERNALIKMAREGYLDEYMMGVYSYKLSKLSGRIAFRQEQYIEGLKENFSRYVKEISSDKDEGEIEYRGDMQGDEWGKVEYYRRAYDDYREDLELGYTRLGPARADLSFKINGKKAKDFASQGQTRSLVLALKLSEGDAAEEKGEMPVFLFDDVLSELDEGRRRFLLEQLEGKQVIITSCEKTLCKGAHLIEAKGGSFSS